MYQPRLAMINKVFCNDNAHACIKKWVRYMQYYDLWSINFVQVTVEQTDIGGKTDKT